MQVDKTKVEVRLVLSKDERGNPKTFYVDSCDAKINIKKVDIKGAGALGNLVEQVIKVFTSFFEDEVAKFARAGRAGSKPVGPGFAPSFKRTMLQKLIKNGRRLAEFGPARCKQFEGIEVDATPLTDMFETCTGPPIEKKRKPTLSPAARKPTGGVEPAPDADIPWRRAAATPRPRRGHSVEKSRGRDADTPWRRAAATPRRRGGHSMEKSRGDAAATRRTFRGEESRRRRGCDVDIPWGRFAATRRIFRGEESRRRRGRDGATVTFGSRAGRPGSTGTTSSPTPRAPAPSSPWASTSCGRRASTRGGAENLPPRTPFFRRNIHVGAAASPRPRLRGMTTSHRVASSQVRPQGDLWGRVGFLRRSERAARVR